MVCKTSISSTGPTTAFRQQYSILRAQGITNPNPRQQFIDDLSSFLEHYQSLGDRILLLGDFNTDLDSPSDSRSLRNMLHQLQLSDLLTHHHPSLEPTSTRLRGHRIDSIFGCPTITNLSFRCGMGLFNSIVDSDHRPIYIDIITTDLLQHTPATIYTPAPRGIHSNNPTECSRYLSALHACLDSHNIFSRAHKLTRWTEKYGATDRLIRRWEALDRDVTAACLAAERKTGSQDRAPWSPKLHQAHLLVLYWKTTVRQLKIHLDPAPAVAAIRFQLTSTPAVVNSLPEALQQLKSASKDLHKIRTAAAQHRQQHLELRANLAAAAQDSKTETILKRIIQAENTKSAYKILRNYLKPNSIGNIGEIEITNPDGTTTTIDDPSEIFERILHRDQRHYSQAQGTPFTQQPLYSFTGIAGDTPSAQQFLNDGTLNLEFNDATFPETIKLLHHMRPFPNRPSRINTTITVDDYRKFFKRWKETTSTSDRRHLGHWKALVSDLAPDDPNKTYADQIIEVIVQQLNLSTTHGYAWRRWRRIISAKIPKRAGLLLLDKLRTIHLFEPDFNWLLGMLFGRRMLHAAHKFCFLHDSQFGSRPGRQALSAVLMKQLSYEVCRLTRTPFASFDNDAKSCYDRIIVPMVMVLCQRLGMPLPPCLMAALCLRYARYYIKTKFGISTSFYCSTDDFPTHGPGQGSRMGPVLWLLISCLLFVAMANLCSGAHFSNPQGDLSIQRTGDGFVDDVTNVCNFGFPCSLHEPITPQLLAQRLQQEAQTWERLLWSTGGALELSKCFYYLLFWSFRLHDGQPYLLPPSALTGCEIQLTSGRSLTPQPIEHKSTTEAHRTLGVWLSPDGNTSPQATSCSTRSNEITQGLRQHKLTRTQAFMAYKHIWLPSVSYPLACSCLTSSQLSHIQTTAIRDFLPHLGFPARSHDPSCMGPSSSVGWNFDLSPLTKASNRPFCLFNTSACKIPPVSSYDCPSIGINTSAASRSPFSLPHSFRHHTLRQAG